MTGETGLPSGVRSPRLAGVDVLRGLCVLLVLLNHIKIRFLLKDLPVGNALPARMEQVLFWSGHYAVVTFFVISGFLITACHCGGGAAWAPSMSAAFTACDSLASRLACCSYFSF